MRYELKSFGIWAFIKVSFFLNLVIGFIFGLLYAVFMGLFLAASSALPFEDISEFPFDTDVVGPVLLIIFPIAFAIGGAIFYTLFGLVVIGAYNVIARLVGGLELTLEPVDRAQPGAPQPATVTPAYKPPPPPPPPDMTPPPPPPPATGGPPTAPDSETT